MFNRIKFKLKKFKTDLFSMKKLQGIILFFSLFVISLFIIMNIPVSKAKLLERIEKDFLKSNAIGISKYIRLEENKVLPFELDPLIRYYNSNPQEIYSLIDNLKNNNKSSSITLKSKSGLFGENYFLNINTVSAEFNFNVEGIEVSLDKKNISGGKSVKGLIPGLYDLRYELNTKYGEVSKVIKIPILNDNNYNIEVNAGNIVVYSNFSDAKVFIDNKDTGVIVENIKEIGLVPTDKGLKLHLEREFPWGNIKSDYVTINDDLYYKLDINMGNDNLINNVNSVINNFYDSTFKALNNKDETLILNSTEEVKSKVYNYIQEKSLLFKNNFAISNLQVIIEKSDFNFEESIYQGNILTSIEYSVFKTLIPFATKKYEQIFLIQIEYEKKGWIVKNIQGVEVDL